NSVSLFSSTGIVLSLGSRHRHQSKDPQTQPHRTPFFRRLWIGSPPPRRNHHGLRYALAVGRGEMVGRKRNPLWSFAHSSLILHVHDYHQKREGLYDHSPWPPDGAGRSGSTKTCRQIRRSG